jgi:hypothetical protein
MKPVLPTLLLLSALGFPAPGHAQTAQTAPPPPPPPSREYFPKTWKSFPGKDGKFSVKFPEPPTESSKSQETARGTVQGHALEFKGGIVVLSVIYTDFPSLPTERKEQAELLERFQGNLLKSYQSVNPKVIRQEEISIEGNPGRHLHLELNGRFVVRVRVFLVGNRVYQLVVQTRKGSPRELEGSDDFEKIATGFFESFQLTEPAPATKSDTPKATPKE